MKELLHQYKPFLLFLGKFGLSYLVLTGLYQWYLGQFDAVHNEVDHFTRIVAEETTWVLKQMEPGAFWEKHVNQPSIKIFYHNTYVCRIIEGCNALSVMILFASFVIAFTGKWKRTILFIVFGCILIHVLNVLRIALLCMALYNFPDWESFLHDIVFPLVIYGIVFLLWVIWVNKYSFYASGNNRK